MIKRIPSRRRAADITTFVEYTSNLVCRCHRASQPFAEKDASRLDRSKTDNCNHSNSANFCIRPCCHRHKSSRARRLLHPLSLSKSLLSRSSTPWLLPRCTSSKEPSLSLPPSVLFPRACPTPHTSTLALASPLDTGTLMAMVLPLAAMFPPHGRLRYH